MGYFGGYFGGDTETVVWGTSGAGARTVTVTVTDGTDPLENAKVRLSEGINTYRADTDVSGVAWFNVDDATYQMAVTKAGYSYPGSPLIVNGDEAAIAVMDPPDIPVPADPDQTMAYTTTRDGKGGALAGVTIVFRLTRPGPIAESYSRLPFTAVSDLDALLTVPLAQDSEYQATRGRGRPVTFRTGDDPTFELPQILDDA